MEQMLGGSAEPTLLSYALKLEPDPLQAGSPADLVLVASNAGDDSVVCAKIVLTLPVGTDGSDLIDGSASIEAIPPAGWTVDQSGGAVAFVAPGGGATVEGQGLVFRIATVANAVAGVARIALEETASPPGMPEQDRSKSFRAGKFPADFSLSDLTPVPAGRTDYGTGDTASLAWVATGEGVSCKLDYQPSDQGPAVSVPVPNVPDGGFYQTNPLTRFGSVTFTLTASVPVPGFDDPLTAVRQLTVSVESLAIDVAVEPPRVGPRGLARLRWSAANADHCLFDDGTRVETSGVRYFLATATRSFTVTAVAADGRTKQALAEIMLDPSIQATEAGYVQTGATGSPGHDYDEEPDPAGGVDGEGTPTYYPAAPGVNGESLTIALSLPPLDTTGSAARVIPISIAGGTGGPGGSGPMPSMGPSGLAANGGPGGDVSVTLALDPSLGPPAQYLISIKGGTGGTGGYPDAAQGSPGSAQATVDGQVLPLAGGGLSSPSR